MDGHAAAPVAISIELEALLRNLIVLFTMQPAREGCVNLRQQNVR
jgi:hypothetical protein